MKVSMGGLGPPKTAGNSQTCLGNNYNQGSTKVCIKSQAEGDERGKTQFLSHCIMS